MLNARRLGFAAICLTGPLALAGCGGGSSNTSPTSPGTTTSSSLPNITTFLANPATTFVVDSSGLAQLVAARPYMGAASGCANNNLTLYAPVKDTEYTIDMYAPAAGTVSKVESCLNAGAADLYRVSIDVASYNGKAATLGISGEPAVHSTNVGATTAQAHPCSGNVAGQDNGFFKKYIFVSEGQQVTPGQRIMQLYVYPLSYYPVEQRNNKSVTQSTSDVQMNIAANNGQIVCPNIFSTTIELQIATKYGNASALGFSCNGAPYPSAICNSASSGENLVGR